MCWGRMLRHTLRLCDGEQSGILERRRLEGQELFWANWIRVRFVFVPGYPSSLLPLPPYLIYPFSVCSSIIFLVRFLLFLVLFLAKAFAVGGR